MNTTVAKDAGIYISFKRGFVRFSGEASSFITKIKTSLLIQFINNYLSKSPSGFDSNNMKVLFNLRIINFMCAALFVFILGSAAFGATFTVTKVADTNDNVCDADCSLREAIAAANAAATDDLINFETGLFAATQVITLTGTQLEIFNSGSLTINGSGKNLLIVSGNNQSRVFFINSGADVTFNDLTISNGSTGIGDGGGILKSGGTSGSLLSTLIINNCNIVNNSAGSSSSTQLNGGSGGGLAASNSAGSIIINNSSINNNYGTNSGGIEGSNNNITVTNSTVSNNLSAIAVGGIGTTKIMNITNSAITNNKSRTSNGGGIYNSDTLNITNSTISDNIAGADGGGIYNSNTGIFNITSSTISNNQAGTVNSGDGGGIRNNNFQPQTSNIRNTIIADNFRGSVSITQQDIRGQVTSQGYNLIKTVESNTIISGDTASNIIGQDPQLLPLGNYGGTTQTHALRPTSPAIDKGSSSGINTDQRGQSRPFDNPSIPNAAGGDGADIGAFERQPNDVNGATLFDFDGDGKADVSAFRPANGVWYLQQSTNGFTGISFGQNGDKIVPADYDGDGKTDVAVFRSGTWYLNRTTQGFTGVSFGASTDQPIPNAFVP